jgi:hypothetical protein
MESLSMEEMRDQAMEVLTLLSEEQLQQVIAFAWCLLDSGRDPAPVLDGLNEEMLS